MVAMMGHQNEQRELLMAPVNILSVIPQDHLVRKLNKILDLGFVRKEVAGFYGQKGQEGVDPVVIMKMMLLLFLDDHKSERQLMRDIPLRIDYLYFLGYELGEAIPNHSVLSKARKRWGSEVFVSLFTRTVEQCLKAGLIDGRKLHMDGSLVRADASLNSVVQITLGKLDEDQELLDRARRQSHGPAAKKDRQKRKWMMEGNFGRGAVEHGMKRARWRGLERQRIQDLLICAIQNLKTLIRKGPCWLKNVVNAYVECLEKLSPLYLLPKPLLFN